MVCNLLIKDNLVEVVITLCTTLNEDRKQSISNHRQAGSLFSFFFGKIYLAGQFHQIKRSLAEQFRQMKCSLAEPQYVVEARAKMSLAIMSKILASGCTN